MTSLIGSIFGEAPAPAKKSTADEGEAPDLFASKASIPRVVSKKTTTTSAKQKDEASTETSKNDTNESSSSQATPEDATEQTNTTKKITKEELKEEEERTVFVGNLPTDITRRALASIFKDCGKVTSARLRSMAVAGVKLPPEQAGNQKMMRKVCANTGKFLTDTPKKSAQGYVVFKSLESTTKALELNNTTYESHTIRVDRANPTVEPTRSVFVGNLPYGADEETLREHFAEQLSEVEDLNERDGLGISGVRIIRDKETQKCKGFGYVTLRDATLVPAALQLHETTYMKRELRVMVCGKRFKGKRGRGDKKSGGGRSFEGQRATGDDGAFRRKRKSDGGAPTSTGGGNAKKRRARSEKKTTIGGNKSGMSKRAATEQKVNKRVKKLQKRAVKGMGKKKH